MAYLWQARQIFGDFFQKTIDETISKIMGFDISDQTDWATYVGNRLCLAKTLVQSQSAEFTPDSIRLKEGFSPCILGYAVDILDEIEEAAPEIRLLKAKIQELK